MRVIAFYTAGTPYQAEARDLRKTLDRFEIAHDVLEMPHPGTASAAKLLKPSVILSARARYPRENLLYLDATARLFRHPILIEQLEGSGYDAAAHYLPSGFLRRLCTGTLWFAPTPAANELVEAWRMACVKPGARKEPNLLHRLMEERPWLTVFKMPPEYCWMAGTSERHWPGCPPPVIYHGGDS